MKPENRESRKRTGPEANNHWNRSFLLNIIFLIAINLLIKPFYLFGIDRTVQNTVAPGEYGLYFALFNFTFLFQIINDFGIQYFNNRNIIRQDESLDRYFPNILILKGLLAIVYFLVLLLVAWFWGYPVSYFQLLLLLGFNQVLSSLIQFLRSNISGLGYYRTDSVISVLDKILMILICGFLLYSPSTSMHFRIEWFVLAQSFSLFATALVSFLLVYRRLQSSLHFRWQPEFLLETLRRSAPYALVVFLMVVYTRIDAVMIERMLIDGKEEADLYASAYRLLDAGNMLGFLFAGLLFPMFARIIKEGSPIDPLVKMSFQLLWAGAVALSTATAFFQQPIMETLYHSGGPYSGRILGLLMISFLAISGSYVYGTLLGANGSLLKMNLIALAGLLCNILLNLLLIPTHKALGAAAATCFTQFVVFFAQVITVNRIFGLGFSPKFWGRVLGFTIAAAGCCFLLGRYVPGPWFFRFISGIGLNLLLAFFFRLINPGQFLELLSGKGNAAGK